MLHTAILSTLDADRKDNIIRFVSKSSLLLIREHKKLCVAPPKSKVQQRINSKMKYNLSCGCPNFLWVFKKCHKVATLFKLGGVGVSSMNALFWWFREQLEIGARSQPLLHFVAWPDLHVFQKIFHTFWTQSKQSKVWSQGFFSKVRH